MTDIVKKLEQARSRAEHYGKLYGAWDSSKEKLELVYALLDDKSVGYDFDYEKDKNTKKTKYVIVSAADAMFSGPETYIFPANKDGEIVDWGELNGSYKGGYDHDKALAGVSK